LNVRVKCHSMFGVRGCSSFFQSTSDNNELLQSLKVNNLQRNILFASASLRGLLQLHQPLLFASPPPHLYFQSRIRIHLVQAGVFMSISKEESNRTFYTHQLRLQIPCHRQNLSRYHREQPPPWQLPFCSTHKQSGMQSSYVTGPVSCCAPSWPACSQHLWCLFSIIDVHWWMSQVRWIRPGFHLTKLGNSHYRSSGF
jgi:hypothetical protein